MKNLQKNTLAAAVLALTLGLGSAAAMAQAASGGMGATDGMAASGPMGKMGSKSPAADKTFVQKASEGGMAEVELSKLAQQKGSSAEVKEFAGKMVDDHTKANDELKQIVTAQGMQPAAALSSKHKSVMAKLEKQNGAAFDKTYMSAMTADHKDTVALMKKESTSGKNADLKAFAGKTLPTIEEHLNMAQTIGNGMKNTAMKDGDAKPMAGAMPNDAGAMTKGGKPASAAMSSMPAGPASMAR